MSALGNCLPNNHIGIPGLFGSFAGSVRAPLMHSCRAFWVDLKAGLELMRSWIGGLFAFLLGLFTPCIDRNVLGRGFHGVAFKERFGA